MKQYSKKLFSIAMLCGTASLMASQPATNTTPSTDSVLPFLQFRSQGRNNARKLVGTTNAIDQYGAEGHYGTFFATLEYDRSFRPSRITKALFGDSLVETPQTTTTTTTTTTNTNNSCKKKCNNNQSIVISGTDLNTRGPREWMAENFLLPSSFKSTLTFDPLVQNVIFDLDFFMGFDRWVSGMYFRLYGPVVNNRTNLRVTENVIAAGGDSEEAPSYQAGFFAPGDVRSSQLYSNALQFFSGAALPGTIEQITVRPLAFAKMNGCGNKSKTGFAELRAELGWNFLRENYRFGLNIQTAAPTGTRPNAEFLLEPQVGNGKHWELGAGFTGAWTMWRSEDEDKHFDFVVEADVTHLFKAKQRRTFDLINKPDSRYMLAEKLTAVPTTTPPTTPPPVNASGFQFAGEYSPVANFSTRDVKVSIGVQGDVVAMFSYTCRGFSWDLGYNYWGMSHEKISLDTCNSDNNNNNCPANVPFAENTWALKGDASVYGTVGGTIIVPLGATESGATIYTGTNKAASSTTNPTLNGLTNPGINSPDEATITINGDSVPLVTLTEIPVSPTDPGTPQPIRTSVPPVFIKLTDFNIAGAEMRGMSNKIFTHFNYTWLERERWVPYVGFGASGEFGSHSDSDNCPNRTTTTPTTTNNCNKSGNHQSFGLSQWAVWVKGGVSFH